MKQKKEAKAETKEVVAEEKQVLTVDFGKVSVQMKFEGAPEIGDYRKSLGNAMRAAAGDIAINDFARTIYYSEEPVEVPEDYVKFILRVVEEKYNIPTQEAFKLLLTL